MRPGLSRVRRAAVTSVLALALVALSACSMLPMSGRVHRDDSGQQASTTGAVFTAPGPARGDSRTEIVNGFLTAMTASPPTSSIARQFLTDAASTTWNPTRGTLVYQASSVDETTASQVLVRLSGPHRLDSRGGWVAGDEAADSGDNRLSLRLVKEKGQWRIANPPDALLIPSWFLDQEYRPYDLYFYDRTDQVLVPDRVFVPVGEQTVSQLVRALLVGPGTRLAPTTRSAFAQGTQLELSVLIGPEGTAEIPMSRELLQLPPKRLDRAATQLAWTLRQIPGISRVRLAVNDSIVSLGDGRRDFSVNEGEASAPYISGATTRIYGLRKGRVVTADPASEASATGAESGAARNDADAGEDLLSGPFGAADQQFRSVGASLDGALVAGVSANGRTVLSAATRGAAVTEGVRTAYQGRDVLGPHYDLFGDGWLVDRTRAGARVVRLAGARTQVVDVPGITGTTVRSFVVSRDGSQLVAVVSDGGSGSGSHVAIARLLRRDNGGVASVLAASRLDGVPADLTDLTSVAWAGADRLAVLGVLDGGRSMVSIVGLDGTTEGEDPQPDVWPTSASRVIGSPDPALPLYLVASSGQVLRLDSSGSWRRSESLEGLVAPTYAG